MTVYRPFTEKLGGSDPATFVGNAGELFYNADTKQVYISDGVTQGGVPIAGGASSSITDGVSTLSFDSNNNITLDTSIIPDTNDAYDLGSAEYKFRDLYLSEATIYMGDTQKLSAENIDRSMEVYPGPAPVSSTSEGKKGDVRFDDKYMYVCIETNKWVRSVIEIDW